MKRIAIVGAGASGLVTASKFKENYVIFEQKSALGGVWNYSNSTLDTNLKLECSGDYFGIQVESEIIPSALYPNLHTNVGIAN